MPPLSVIHIVAELIATAVIVTWDDFGGFFDHEPHFVPASRPNNRGEKMECDIADIRADARSTRSHSQPPAIAETQGPGSPATIGQIGVSQRSSESFM